MMSKPFEPACELTLSDVVPVLRRAGLLRRTSFDESVPPPGRGILRVDSRRVAAGDLFLAYQGVSSDGHDHLPAALTQGAALLVVERGDAVPRAGSGPQRPFVEVTSGRAAWSELAAHGFGQPQKDLILLGVTGTNGKTSTAWMTGQLLGLAGVSCLTIGTLGAYLDGRHLGTSHTTPDPDVLFGLLAAARQAGCRAVAMEVSSHALVQEKLRPLRFAACAFTSFSRDHLDFHGTMDAYWAAKWRLFQELAAPSARQILADVLSRPPALARLGDDSFVYGLGPRPLADTWGARDHLTLGVKASDLRGSTVELASRDHRIEARVPYFARHALENLAAAVLLASKVTGRWPEPKALERLTPVPGRLEQVLGPAGSPGVIVDYAHTPDALEKTLAVLRPICRGQLVVVFGCGGDRDRGKRPLMGRVAETLADRVLVTSDNPRTEDPLRIIDEILAGTTGRRPLQVESDRASAIRAAIRASGPDDLVLIAGKGHETYQILGKTSTPFDDREVARAILTRKEET